MKASLVATIQVGFVYLTLFGLAAWFRRRGTAPALAIGGAVAILAVASLATFWLAWASLPDKYPAAAIRRLLVISGLLAAAYAIYRQRKIDEIVPPLAVAFLASLALLLWTHHGFGPRDPLREAAERWTHSLPGDNRIPFDFALAIIAGHIPSPLHGNWLSSDRPPLQTAMFMLTPKFGKDPFAYQAASVAFQMIALLGAWALARSLGAGQRASIMVMAVIFFTPLTIVNGAYVWPKLLAASFVCFAVSVHFTDEYWHARGDWKKGTYIGALSALGLLSHGATAFALLGMVLAALVLRRWATLRYCVAALLAAVVLHVPWTAYQAFADPPGNRLVKWHLAGVEHIDGRTSWQALRDSYGGVTWRDIMESKLADVRVIYGGVGEVYTRTVGAVVDFVAGNGEEARRGMQKVRELQFYHFIASAGLLGMSFLLLPLALLCRRVRPTVVVIMGSVVAWIGFLFLPGTTVVHTGSYFPEIALIVAAALLCIWRLRNLAPVLLVGHIGVTILHYAL